MLAVTVGASSAGAVSFRPAETLPVEFSVGGNGLFIHESGAAYQCTGETTGSGTIEGEASGTVTLEFHGCNRGGLSCTSSGAEKGTIVTAPLAMDLTEIAGEEGLGLVLDPTGNDNFADFYCSYLLKMEWVGSLIGKITAPAGYNSYSSEFTFELAAIEGTQLYTETAHGRKTHLASYVNGGEDQGISVDGDVNLDIAYDQELYISPEGNDHPDIVPAKGFPAPFVAGTGEKVVLRTPATTVTCTESEESWAGSGSGEFNDSSSGEVEFTFHSCKAPGGIKCTSPGQAKGTVKTKPLPVELTYLSDAGPGLALGSTAFMEMECSFLLKIVVSGGVLGTIPVPALGESWFSLESGIHAVEQGGKFVQEYTQTEGGEPFGLQAVVNGETEAATLDMPMALYFGEFESQEPSFEELLENLEPVELRE
jgi:hypothetical protein